METQRLLFWQTSQTICITVVIKLINNMTEKLENSTQVTWVENYWEKKIT